MSDDACVAIQKWQHPTNGPVIYFPVGQELPDTEQTLVQAGLLGRRSDGVVVLDTRSPRVICWQLTNAAARRCGHGDIWEDLPADLYEDLPGSRRALCWLALRHAAATRQVRSTRRGYGGSLNCPRGSWPWWFLPLGPRVKPTGRGKENLPSSDVRAPLLDVF